MKRLLKNLAFLLLLTCPSIISYSQVPLNWTVDEINPGEDILLIPEVSNFTEGLKSCHMQLKSGSVPYLISDVFFITPGADYEFSIDVFDNDTAGQVKIYADFYDTYGFDIFGHPPLFSSDSSEWQSISWSGIIPDQAVVGYVLIKFYNQPDLYHFTKTAEIWLDHVQFREAGGNNLVTNGGFEDWLVGINENGDDRLMFIYPNPAGDFINVDLPGQAKSFIITDMAGREVIRVDYAVNGPYQIDVKCLPGGLYLTTAILDNNSVLRGKLLKQ